jgi:hypothetical protein
MDIVEAELAEGYTHMSFYFMNCADVVRSRVYNSLAHSCCESLNLPHTDPIYLTAAIGRIVLSDVCSMNAWHNSLLCTERG